MSQRVVFKDGVFYPKGITTGKNFLKGRWYDKLDPTETVWSHSFAYRHATTEAFMNAVRAQEADAVMDIQGEPVVRMDLILNTPDAKAQFLQDLEDRTLSIKSIGMGAAAHAAAQSTFRNVLTDDPEFARALYIAAVKDMESHSSSSNLPSPYLIATLQGGEPDKPLVLTGTGITEERYIEAVGLTSEFNSPVYKNQVIFDEEK